MDISLDLTDLSVGLRCSRRCGIQYYEISHLFSQWGAAMAPKIMGNKDGKQIQLFGWDTDATGAEYGEFLHQFLIAFKAELEKWISAR